MKRGFTYIELIIFTLVLAICLAGVLAMFTQAGAKSAEAFVYKQGLEVAQSLMEEIQSFPYTYCDPNDPNFATVSSEAGCTIAQPFGPNLGQTRLSTVNRFNHVLDYAGYTQFPVSDLLGNTYAGLSNYSVNVQMQNVQIDSAVPANDTLKVTITLTGPSGNIVLFGYKLRYAPNGGA